MGKKGAVRLGMGVLGLLESYQLFLNATQSTRQQTSRTTLTSLSQTGEGYYQRYLTATRQQTSGKTLTSLSQTGEGYFRTFDRGAR